MSISMHSASVPIFVRMLGNLSQWLDKAEAHAAARQFDPAVLLGARLALLLAKDTALQDTMRLSQRDVFLSGGAQNICRFLHEGRM